MIESVPVVEKALVKVALFFAIGALPRVADPFMNVTDPVMVAWYCAATVAVNVTVWLSDDGFGFEMSVVVVEAWLTT